MLTTKIGGMKMTQNGEFHLGNKGVCTGRYIHVYTQLNN